jgi:UDP-N-acetylglucosamine 1-carboxyvinyltransferase
MILAGLCAKGMTTVTNIEYILRGYENLDKKLNELGAKISIQKE